MSVCVYVVEVKVPALNAAKDAAFRTGHPRGGALRLSLIIKRFFMAAILERIVAATRARVAAARREADLRELERQAELHVPRGFRRALELKSREGVAVIAELKKASPSRE